MRPLSCSVTALFLAAIVSAGYHQSCIQCWISQWSWRPGSAWQDQKELKTLAVKYGNGQILWFRKNAKQGYQCWFLLFPDGISPGIFAPATVGDINLLYLSCGDTGETDRWHLRCDVSVSEWLLKLNFSLETINCVGYLKSEHKLQPTQLSFYENNFFSQKLSINRDDFTSKYIYTNI